MPPQASPGKPLTLFYSYAHEDEKLRDVLAKHLTLLTQQGVIKEWHDRQIAPGDAWEDAIDEHLETADIILLLISVDFIASPYCWGKEMARALARHNSGEARVIPIILRPVDWTGAPFASLQALPKDGKPVVLWPNKEVAWVDVARGVRKAVEELSAGQPAARPATSQAIIPARIVEAAPHPRTRSPEQRQGQLHRTVYSAENGMTLPGTVIRQEGDPPVSDIAVNEAYDGLGAAYHFFYDVYGRDSIDGKGMPLEVTVHFGQRYNNAFWNGKQIICGDGDGQLFTRFTKSVDIIAKQFANGVIQAQTKLVYWRQSGALFNSIAIVFACLVKQYTLTQTVDQADWLFGAGLFAPQIKGKALSSLADPGTAYNDPLLGVDPQPAHMRDYVNTANDNGGVHINSGIPCRAFYLIATALGGYAWEKAGRIWYGAMSDITLKAEARFNDFAQLTLKKARQLYGVKSDEVQAVARGWDLVGVKTEETKSPTLKAGKSTSSTTPRQLARRSRK
jgi:hypothetical protein